MRKWRSLLNDEELEKNRAADRLRKMVDSVRRELADIKETENSRIRKIAQRLRVRMPTHNKVFRDVLLHMSRNERRNEAEKETASNKTKKAAKALQLKLTLDRCKEVNKTLRLLKNLKRQHRFTEQQSLAAELRKQIGSYRNIASVAGSTLKYVYEACTVGNKKVHKSTKRFEEKKEEFHRFLAQDSVTFALAGKRYAGKRFLCDT